MKATKVICGTGGSGTTGDDYSKSYNATIDISNLNNRALLTSLSDSGAYIDFDFSASFIRFKGQFKSVTVQPILLTIKPTEVIVGTDIDLSITSSTRFIYHNVTDNVFIALDSDVDITPSLAKELYFVASINPINNEVISCAFPEYKVNGNSDVRQGKSRANLLDYVKGQSLFGEQFSFALCDLYRESGISILNKDTFIQPDQLHPNTAAYTFISQQTTDFIRKYGGFTSLTGKTIGVFGGSFSVITESQACKNVWVSELGITYTDYGVSGAGFAKSGNYIDTQADAAASHDIYILWCSTNDASNDIAVGVVGDTTHDTQHGGMYATVLKLLALNPSAKILILNSLKAYDFEYQYNPSATR